MLLLCTGVCVCSCTEQALVAKNKAAGEPDDDATEQISVATECVTMAKHLQVMMGQCPSVGGRVG